jgi:DNA-binding response OmpR family regulator
MSERKLIVIAEDEADAAALLEYHLKRSGYRTAIASDGLAALNESFAQRPALILLDLMMPKLDGFQVCRMLKTSPLTKSIPVIIVSALDAAENKLRGFGQGADDYMAKPYEMSELLTRVNALVARPAPMGRHEPLTSNSDR